MAAEVDSRTPSYWECVTEISSKVGHYFETNDLDFTTYPSRFIADCRKFCYVDQQDVLAVVGLALLMTIMRSVLTKAVFLPMASYFRLTQLNASKFPESAWKTILYGTMWFSSLYMLVISDRYNYFRNPNAMWSDWKLGQDVPFDVYAIYITEFAFYMHSVYGTVYIDRWRKDSLVMIFHHFLTMALIGFSFASRYHKIGLVVLFLHDCSDICLEFTKINVYFKNRNGKYYAIHEYISTVGFLGFAVSWYICRLYWFPRKVLYSAGVSVWLDDDAPAVPFYFFFNFLLWILQALNVYWFMFIVSFLVKVATGQMSEVDDIREDEVVESVERKRTESMRSTNSESGGDGDNNLSNGTLASKQKLRPNHTKLE